MRGRFGEADIVYALLQVDWNRVAHDREVLIVNGKPGRRGQGGKRQENKGDGQDER